jgi:thiamine biosynthesis lipoprotein
MKRPLFAISLLFALLALGCSKPTDKVIEQQFYVFGTVVTLSYYGIDDQQAAAAGAEVNRMFRQMHDDWHAWQKGALTDINKGIAEGRPVPVRDSLIPLIEKSQEAARLSDDLFNPAIGKLIGLWGFHSSEMPTGPIPSEAEIRKLVAAHPTMADVQIKDRVLTSKNRAVQFDFGGVAKGYAVELALKRLQEMGVKNAIVNTGGGLGVIGRHGDRAWRVGIRDPIHQGILGSLELQDGENCHTSGNYERFREWQGKRYSHIIDPRTGWPVQQVVSATVIHTDGALADAFTKPFIVGGTDEWYEFAKRLHLKSVMVVDTEGTVYMTPEMQKRVTFETPPKKIVVSGPVD